MAATSRAECGGLLQERRGWVSVGWLWARPSAYA